MVALWRASVARITNTPSADCRCRRAVWFLCRKPRSVSVRPRAISLCSMRRVAAMCSTPWSRKIRTLAPARRHRPVARGDADDTRRVERRRAAQRDRDQRNHTITGRWRRPRRVSHQRTLPSASRISGATTSRASTSARRGGRRITTTPRGPPAARCSTSAPPRCPPRRTPRSR